ncbi:MAG TPA: cyclase family protein [Streptosporangiaceae bacterium]|nr:cyclase family protein [Streptosporangiaceae bacterium]
MTAHRGRTATPAKPAAALTEAEFRELYDGLRAQLPWSKADRRGALNYLTAAETMAAAREVRHGRSVSLAAPIEHRVSPDNPEPARHTMTETGADADPAGLSFATDQIAMNIHGDADSHIDALWHVIYDHALYNDVPANRVTQDGAAELSIALAADGLVGRGVLLDIPGLRGVPWLEPGDYVTVDDLLAAEEAQQVRFGRGDLLFIRVGHRLRRAARGPWDAAAKRVGLHPTVLPLLAERQIAVLGSDSNNDTASPQARGADFPVHVLAIRALGLHLLDYLQFETLLPLCEKHRQWSFLCVIAPLKLPNGTGSPINPIAIL